MGEELFVLFWALDKVCGRSFGHKWQRGGLAGRLLDVDRLDNDVSRTAGVDCIPTTNCHRAIDVFDVDHLVTPDKIATLDARVPLDVCSSASVGC
jgi:hypothetical protein